MLLIIYLLCISFLIQGIGGRNFGRIGCIVIALFCLGLSVLISWIMFYEIVLLGSMYNVKIMYWINIGTMSISWGLNCNSTVGVMVTVVLFISLLVHIYSIDYMYSDAHRIRFIAYLTLFTLFMLILVSADNFLQMFLGWEGVGLVSYLLVNFWFTRIEANRSALKAIIVNRVGDYALGMSMLIMYYVYRSLDYGIIFCVNNEVENLVSFNGIRLDGITLIVGLLFIGAIGKSAQIGLHIWLPDAMEGPTPVSALIHAATMVTAGVFILIRSSQLLECSEVVQMFIIIIGGLTALFAGTTGMYQNDIKKVIAFSTCSQLGFMVVSCGFSAYSLALFHLVNHAFFKALLFLSAGLVIHSINDEQDMRRMGGLSKVLPVSYISVLIGSLALSGFPYLAGFYSKELIFGYGQMGFTVVHEFVFFILIIAGFCTSFYSFRLLRLVFFGETRISKKIFLEIFEGGKCIIFVLSVLGVCSVSVGFLLKEVLNVGGVSAMNSLIYAGKVWYIEYEVLESIYKILPMLIGIFGMVIGIFIYEGGKGYRYTYNKEKGYYIYIYIVKKWCIDIIYNELINDKVMRWGYEVGYKSLDRGLLGVIGSGGLVKMVKWNGLILSYLQSGYLYHLSLEFIVSIILFLSVDRYLYLNGIFLIYIYILYYIVKLLEEEEEVVKLLSVGKKLFI